MTHRILADRIRLKRAYEPASADDGARILVERLWPRGLSKQTLALTEWARDVAPSTALRQWYGHEPTRWDGFRQRYAAELRQQPAALEALRQRARAGVVTLIYAARTDTLNNAVALREFLLDPARLAAGA